MFLSVTCWLSTWYSVICTISEAARNALCAHAESTIWIHPSCPDTAELSGRFRSMPRTMTLESKAVRAPRIIPASAPHQIARHHTALLLRLLLLSPSFSTSSSSYCLLLILLIIYLPPHLDRYRHHSGCHLSPNPVSSGACTPELRPMSSPSTRLNGALSASLHGVTRTGVEVSLRITLIVAAGYIVAIAICEC